MSLSIISEAKKQQEQQIQKQIFQAIDNYDDMIFNAGAGAGKTYALIESLKYIIEEKGARLNRHNQNVICITYTNVATNEIKERLGNTTLVKVSTIHERLWDLIKNYQKQLVKIHKEKIENELEILQEELNTDSKFQKYRDIEDKDIFVQSMIEHKDDYYQNRNKPADTFRKSIKSFLNFGYHDLLSNVGTFKSLVGRIYKIENFKECLELIENSEYKEVIYDERFNTDRLHKMMISHDTLLEYSYLIVSRYDLLKQIIIDRYPYILVDEYQDTDKCVVKILVLLTKYAKKINHNFFVGYFGDTAQNIYDTGIGSEIFELHLNLIKIDKAYNRRSTNEIIKVINKIRNDNIKQESIYDDADGGSVKFYQGTKDDIDSFIQKYKEEWNITKDNKLHCLVLTNELVAKYNGFENFYTKLKSIPYYKTNWKNITKNRQLIFDSEMSLLDKIKPNMMVEMLPTNEGYYQPAYEKLMETIDNLKPWALK
jgi:DNA helicase-2/ATP-dependent DNA helicase PcrA